MLLRVRSQDGPDGRVDLGVHQHHVLLVLERLEDDVRAELDRAGDVDDHVDLRGAAQQHWVFGHDRLTLADRLVHGGLRAVALHVAAPGVLIDMEGAFGLAIVDARHAHAGDAVDDLVRQTLPHEPRADHADADGFALRFASFECCVDDDHACPL